jgi:glycosyltransferase involved in cell wall biosynthesis
MTDPTSQVRLCIVINPAFGLHTCYGQQYIHLQERGYTITAVSGEGAKDHEFARNYGIDTFVVPMMRYPSPIYDLRSLLALVAFFRKHQFDVVQVSTPKASLLGILAARIAGQRGIMYFVRGRAYECKGRISRWLYARLDRMCCELSDMVVPVSGSLRDALVADGVCRPEKLRLVANGSSRGIDPKAWEDSCDSPEQAARLRMSLGIGPDDIVVLFVGWVRQEKGVAELIDAVVQSRSEDRRIHLVVVGDLHQPCDLGPSTLDALRGMDGIHWCGSSADVVPYYFAADIFALPSWREGFPRVALEAAAARLPVISTLATGCRDSVVNGETGLLVPVRDRAALSAAIASLASNESLRKQMGSAGAKWVRTNFSQSAVWDGMEALLRELASRTKRARHGRS